jgi:hypothetical protein
MNKIYYVTIKGRTFESRDLKELLARAVSEKRNPDRKSILKSAFAGRTIIGNASGFYGAAGNV